MLFSMHSDKGGLEAPLRQYFDQTCQQLAETEDAAGEQVFVERLEMLLQSEDPGLQQLTLRWLFEDFIKHHRLPERLHQPVFQRLRALTTPMIAYPLLDWLAAPDAVYRKDIPMWLAELKYARSAERHVVISALLNLYLSVKGPEFPVMEALKHLDTIDGEVTDLALYRFPGNTMEHNQRIIELLGQSGRYRVVKPLISFCGEYPEYLRNVMQTLKKFEYDEVDQFYLRCLDGEHRKNPMVLIEAVKQVRKRRLRKAIPLMDALFPMEDSKVSLVDRAVNGEIALTMASFGVYGWAREKLLSEMMLNGINQKYLKAVDMLNLQEAVPLLKAILLMPETPEISVIQDQAYQICERLLMGQKANPRLS
jgi:hypothetical protein